MVCDIYFTSRVPKNDPNSIYDDSLRLEMQQLNNILVAGVPNPDRTALQKQMIGNVPQASVAVLSKTNVISKFQLWQNQLKSLPLALYEKLEKQRLPFLHFNHIPIATYIQNKDLEKYQYFGSLEDFEAFGNGSLPVEVSQAFFEENFQDKIMVLGDFSSNDMVLTPKGKSYGTLVLLNTYLSLKAGRAHISVFWLLFLYLSFAILSYRALYVTKLNLPVGFIKILRFPLFRFLDYFWMGLALSFISYFVFGVHLSVVFIFVYLKVIRYLNLGKKLRDLEKDLLIANKENERLLWNIMPKDVADELKKNSKTKIRKFDSATILFADVKGFSKKAKELQETNPQTASEDLIALLDATFSTMDKICEKHQVERIKTIGDCYMAVAGVPITNKTHVLDTALVALQIQKWMSEERQKRKGDFWQVRLGFHSGELVAGVIGTQRFAYDVWGADVNVASRMESGGAVGKVNTTEYCKNVLKDFFEFEYRGEIEAKNIGKVKAYFLNRIKPEFSEDVEGFVPNAKFAELKQKVFGV